MTNNKCFRCGAQYPSRGDADSGACLSCQTAQRLRWAGFTEDSPELVRLREWNASVASRSQPEGDRRSGEGTIRAAEEVR